MDYFNLDLREELNNSLLSDNSAFKVIKIYGNLGCGKTHTIVRVLQDNSIEYVPIIFSEYNVFPFQKLIKKDISGSEEEQFLMSSSILFQKGIVMFYQNIEKCSQDHIRLLFRLFEYHKNSGNQATVILEYNSTENSSDCLSALVEYRLFVKPTPPEDFLRYLRGHFYSEEKNQSLFNKILTISHENLQNFFVTLNILKQEEIIGEKDELLHYIKPEVPLPNNLLSLYGKLFDSLDSYMQNSLRAAVPFAPNIYNRILKIIIQNYSNFENYLDELSQFETMIRFNNDKPTDDTNIFCPSFIFMTDVAIEAVCHKISQNELNNLTRRYYDYLDKIYHNRNEYDILSESDKIHLLINLTKNRRGYLTINQIPLIVDIMTYYYEHFLYFSAIEHGEAIIKSSILNTEQMNMEFHSFYLIYFKSLLAVGCYERIIAYKGQFSDEDLNFFMALAFYNQGQPYVALNLLDNLGKGDKKDYQGYKDHLIASIYDWLGDNKKSLEYFKRALKACTNEDSLKYQLYKKYSMHVDFRLPECKLKIKQAIEFYEHKDIKQMAECMHNYGTSCVMAFDFEEAKTSLDKCKYILAKICNEEIYYPLNSLAILFCIQHRDIDSAIKLLNEALNHHIEVDFCLMAIRNNCFNMYIHQNDWNAANVHKVALETKFYEICRTVDNWENLKDIRPDLQHQLRQYYYNCAILHKTKNEYKEALEFFYRALKCSTYNSVMEYAIYKNIDELESALQLKKQWFNRLKKPLQSHEPTKIELFIYLHDMYLCEIMFWG